MYKVRWKSTDSNEWAFESPAWLEEWRYKALIASLQSDPAVYEIEIMEQGGEWRKL